MDRHSGKVLCSIRRTDRRRSTNTRRHPFRQSTTFAVGAFNQCIHRFMRQMLSPVFPSLAFISCCIHHRSQAIVAITVEGDHKQFGVMMRPCNLTHPQVHRGCAFSKLGLHGERKFAPSVASVFGNVNEAIVTSNGQSSKMLGFPTWWSVCRKARFRHPPGQVTADDSKSPPPFMGDGLCLAMCKMLLVLTEEDGRLPIHLRGVSPSCVSDGAARSPVASSKRVYHPNCEPV